MGASGYVREGGESLNTQYSIVDPWNLNPETQTYYTIQGLRVRDVGGDVRQGGGSLNNHYSIIDPWTLNPETQTYNTDQGFRVQGAMSGRGGR